jgi:hypothetical protein
LSSPQAARLPTTTRPVAAAINFFSTAVPPCMNRAEC